MSDAVAEGPPVVSVASGLPARLEPCVLLVDKPAGVTSFAVVRRVRSLAGVKRVGHAGTLDPMATGLLIVLVGREATRLQDRFMGLPKSYAGSLRLGESTPSYDAETAVVERVDPAGVTGDELESVIHRFEGVIEQLPPMYSAIKVGGERLYRKARRGEDIERQPRRVHVTRLALTARDGPDVAFEVDCSKGTYVRSLAHDIGRELGVGAHLTALRRTAIGPYRVEDAWTLEQLADSIDQTGQEA
jgi:tRNA pseudouridine55 synthase